MVAFPHPQPEHQVSSAKQCQSKFRDVKLVGNLAKDVKLILLGIYTLQAAENTADQRLPGGLLSNMQSMEEVGHLVMKMSQAGQNGDIFKIFAEHVTQLVPGLTHIRYSSCQQQRLA